MAFRLSHVLCWCVMMAMSSDRYNFWCRVMGTLSQSCVSDTSIRPWRSDRLAGLDGGASRVVIRLHGVSWNACDGARPRRVGGGGGVVLHRAYTVL